MEQPNMEIYNSVPGQGTSSTPEISEEINLQLPNCAFDDDEKLTGTRRISP